MEHYYRLSISTTPINLIKDTTLLWHLRLGHISEICIKELHKNWFLKGVKTCKLNFCKFCVIGKQCKVKFKIANPTSKGVLDYIHFDIWDPVDVISKGGYYYFLTFIDDYSRKVWVYFMKQKFETFEKFRVWKTSWKSNKE